MKSVLKLVSIVLVASCAIPGVALAAASPTVITGAATSITDTSAVLQARVNPSSSPTDFYFQIGPTAAYGVNGQAKAIGSGSKGIDVSATFPGLTPGTLYHYRVVAQNSGGVTAGADRTFTTAGFPPASVATGPAASVGVTSATPTGSIDPMGEATTWAVQYGATAAYGYSTFIQPALPALEQALPVSVAITGLAPATLFHYRLVAYHGDSTTFGADETFFTEPLVRPKPNLTTRTTPSTAKRSPYTYTIAGTLHGDGYIPAAQRCTGNVGIRVDNGRRQLAFLVAPLSPGCTFSATASFRRDHGTGRTPLTVTIDFRGNGYLASVTRIDHVAAG